MLLFDFTHHNIEMACALLETCGRFLYRSLDSHHRTRVYLVSRTKRYMQFELLFYISLEYNFVSKQNLYLIKK